MQAETRSAPPLAFLILMSALAVLPVNLFVPSLPAIAREFGADFYIVNISIAGYAVAVAVTHLVSGALSDRYGRKPVVTAGLVIFTAASIGCALATSIHAFLLFRMLQATVISGYAASLAIIRDTSSDHESAGRIGYVSSAWAVAPMLGPIAGGLIDAWLGWRANFVMFALLGAAALYAVIAHLRETNERPVTSMRTQFGGYAELLRSRQFWTLASCMACAIGTLYAFLGGAPLVATELGVTSTAVIGVYLALVPAGFITGSFIVGRYGTMRPAAHFMLLGRVITCGGLIAAIVLTLVDADHALAFFAPCVCVGLGNGLTMPSANAKVLSLNSDLAGTASGLASAFTVIGAGAIAFAAGTTLVPPHARLTVLLWMLGASVLSLVAAALFVRGERVTD